MTIHSCVTIKMVMEPKMSATPVMALLPYDNCERKWPDFS